jgi:putative hemolysin
MKLLTSRELARAAKLDIPGGVIIAKSLMQIFRYNRLNRVYSSIYESDPVAFINSILEHLDIRYDVPAKDLENLPRSGPYVTVSNHPFGGIDALILLKILMSTRPDVKEMANFLLKQIDPLKNLIIPVEPFSSYRDVRSAFMGIKEAVSYVNAGHVVAVFPAGEVSTYQSESNIIVDREWQETVIRIIKMANVPVVPIYFHGTNSRWFHILGRIHPLLQTAKLGSEIINKKHKTIRVRIGKPLSVREQGEFSDIAQFSRYLRARTYSLGSALEAKPFFLESRHRRSRKQEPVAEPVDRMVLREEFNSIQQPYELFAAKNYSVLFAPTRLIPNFIKEIGRLREITFRAVGEGTNRGTDIDEYDFYYHHLIIWDRDTDSVIGAYRIGKGKEILSLYGMKGFYISSLFRIKKTFEPILNEALELGRSFIVPEYQRKPMSLFLLWKGLLTVLIKHAEYRYLIGPVSISNEFSDFSKSLLVEFIMNHYYDADLAEYIRPRRKFNLHADKRFDRGIFINSAENDINRVEKVVSDVESGYKIPVLLKKYLEINARIIGFNVDPDFNNCLDGLMILDVYNIPHDFVRALSKDHDEESIRQRFGTKQK